jgi:glycosyltransferase involved in cell wall biosynthesis
MILSLLDKCIGKFPSFRRSLVRLIEIRSFDEDQVVYRKTTHNQILSFQDLELDLLKKRLGVDGQCLLNATRERGIGKYTWKLILELSTLRQDMEIVLLIPSIFSRVRLSELKSEIENANLSNVRVKVINIFDGQDKSTLHEAQLAIRKACTALSIDAVLIPSNFEHPSSVVPFDLDVEIPTLAIFYDLIPLSNPESLLFSRLRESTYQWQLHRLLKFNFIFTISDFSRSILVRKFSSIACSRSVWGGPGINLTLENSNAGDFDSRRGVLVIGAELPHKNLPQMIKAYSLISQSTKRNHPLTIVGIRSSGYRSYLQKIANKHQVDLKMPKYLSEISLAETYSATRLVVVPSRIEGLSLPILEAWHYDCVAIGGKGTVAQEIIGDPKLLFDVMDPVDLSRRIESLLNSKALWEDSLMFSQQRKKLFTWENTVKLVADELERLW